MHLANGQVTIDIIADVLGSFRKKGVRLWSENGQLHYKAPKGALTQVEIERLKAWKGQIVDLLEGVTGTESVLPSGIPSPRLHRAPLTFSQLAHWNSHRLGERPTMRIIASATRLRGRLNVGALQTSLTHIVGRHDALRTRIVLSDGSPLQEISEPRDCELTVFDLTTTPEHYREAEVLHIIEQHILEPIDIAVGGLFGVRLLRLRTDEHVLILAMEHMISDMFSMNLLIRDLFTAYMQALEGRPFSLPELPIQFADYAVWQTNAQRSWIENHGAYWSERLKGCQRVRFPGNQSVRTEGPFEWGTVPIQIGRSLKTELREWCRLKRTTLAMSIFTAYVGLVLRWCNTSESVIRFQSDGRASPEIQNTIGFFASVLYLRIEIRQGDSFVDLMKRVTEEYCNAYERADYSYMAAQLPRAEFTRNTVFNWVPQGCTSDLSGLDGSENAISCSPVRFESPMSRFLEIDIEPAILLFDNDDDIAGDVHFPRSRFSVDTMERFGRNFIAFIGVLLRQPEARVKDILLL